MWVFDIESNGLLEEATKIHCMVAYNVDTEELKKFTNNSQVINFFSNNREEPIVGHYITLYDVPLLEKLLGIKINNPIIDTLPISWYLYPDLHNHGLESWGERLGVKKPKVKDWKTDTLETYLHRCTEDVRINTKLWDLFRRYLGRLYGEDSSQIVNNLVFKMQLIRMQENNSLKLDVETCEKNIKSLGQQRDPKLERLKSEMFLVPKYSVRKKPLNMLKADGTKSKKYEEWEELIKDTSSKISEDGLSVKIQVGTKEPNPNSNDQIKKWLTRSFNWKPCTFTKGANGKVPQINNPDDKTQLTQSVKDLIKKNPTVELLQGITKLKHRQDVLRGFTDNQKGGRVTANIGGIAKTLRMRHRKPFANLPKEEIIRGCIVADEGMQLVGADLSSIENVTRNHWISLFDPKYVDTMLQDDYDSHLDLAKVAGFLNDEDITFYKNKDNKGTDRWKEIKGIRDTTKTGNYACLYGAGIPRLMEALVCDRKKATEVWEGYWKLNWAVKEVSKKVWSKRKTIKKDNWIYNPMSKFWIFCENERDVFSRLNQSSAVYCFDLWLYFIIKSGIKVMMNYHDEFLFQVKKGTPREEIQAKLDLATKKLNEKLNLYQKVSYDYEVGQNYWEVH